MACFPPPARAVLNVLSISKASILQIGSLCSPPPYPAAPDFPLCRGQNRPLYAYLQKHVAQSLAPIVPPAKLGGKVVAPATKGGAAFPSRRRRGCMFFPRPPGRLYAFLQTGGEAAYLHPLNPLNLLSRVDGIRLLCPPLTEPYVRFSRIRLLE